MTLLEYVQEKLNESGTDAKLSADLLTAIIKRNRIFDYEEVVRLLGQRSTIEINTDTGLLTIPLKDIYDGTASQYQYYTGPVGVHLHPDGRYFISESGATETEWTEDSPAEVTFDPIAFTLDFNTAHSGEVDVEAIGHLVNLEGPYGVLYEAWDTYLGWIRKLPNLRGREMTDLVKHVRAQRDQYTTGFIRGGFRA